MKKTQALIPRPFLPQGEVMNRALTGLLDQG